MLAEMVFAMMSTNVPLANFPARVENIRPLAGHWTLRPAAKRLHVYISHVSRGRFRVTYHFDADPAYAAAAVSWVEWAYAVKRAGNLIASLDDDWLDEASEAPPPLKSDACLIPFESISHRETIA